MPNIDATREAGSGQPSSIYKGWYKDQANTRLSVVVNGVEALRFAKSSTGVDFRWFGDTVASNYVNWDASAPALDFVIAKSGSTADDIMSITVTDTQTLASGYMRAIYVNWTHTGAQTGGYINPISIDFAATTANCTEVALESHYITQTGNYLTGNVFVWQAYMEDVGSNAGNVVPLDIGRVCTNTGSSRDCFIRFKQHATSGGATTVILAEGTNNVLATNFITFIGSTDCFAESTTLSGGIIGRIKINRESTPGGTSATYYIPTYSS